tara:strand:+ start:263 stop:538 length:276 start_codon:yes stop_codon:yes gene_type:complete
MQQLYRVWVKERATDRWKVLAPHGGQGWCTEVGACERIEELFFNPYYGVEEIVRVKVMNAIDMCVWITPDSAVKAVFTGEGPGSFGEGIWN